MNNENHDAISDNAAKMREALSRILGITDHLQTRFAIPKFASEEILELKQIAESAISATPRNCDVGTVDEQLDRYGLFCQNKCPICENRFSCHICGERYRMKCMVAWAQMPYEEGETK